MRSRAKQISAFGVRPDILNRASPFLAVQMSGKRVNQELRR